MGQFHISDGAHNDNTEDKKDQKAKPGGRHGNLNIVKKFQGKRNYLCIA